MFDDRHRALKRWERARQWAALEKEPELVGPAASCRFKRPTGGSDRIPVFIVEIFAKDLVCVKTCAEPCPPDAPGPFWLVRDGIDWAEYLPRVIRHYRVGLPVPVPFRPLRKIGGELVSRLESLPTASLPEVFGKMREGGLLPRAQPLTQATCPSCLPWDRIRSLFQDFKG
jgi:hypothetical protein